MIDRNSIAKKIRSRLLALTAKLMAIVTKMKSVQNSPCPTRSPVHVATTGHRHQRHADIDGNLQECEQRIDGQYAQAQRAALCRTAKLRQSCRRQETGWRSGQNRARISTYPRYRRSEPYPSIKDQQPAEEQDRFQAGSTLSSPNVTSFKVCPLTYSRVLMNSSSSTEKPLK